MTHAPQYDTPEALRMVAQVSRPHARHEEHSASSEAEPTSPCTPKPHDLVF